jgi:hypothetical protein
MCNIYGHYFLNTCRLEGNIRLFHFPSGTLQQYTLQQYTPQQYTPQSIFSAFIRHGGQKSNICQDALNYVDPDSRESETATIGAVTAYARNDPSVE